MCRIRDHISRSVGVIFCENTIQGEGKSLQKFIWLWIMRVALMVQNGTIEGKIKDGKWKFYYNFGV
jgi:hypothetical protein